MATLTQAEMKRLYPELSAATKQVAAVTVRHVSQIAEAAAKSWSATEEQQLRQMYDTHTRAQIAVHLGRSAASVRAKCGRLKLNWKHDPEWTDQEVAALKAYYTSRQGLPVDLSELVQQVGRLQSNICRKARELGLTDQFRKKVLCRKQKNKFATAAEWKADLSQRTKARMATNHPRGMAGKKHTQEALKKISEMSRANQAKLTPKRRQEINVKARETRVANGKPYNPHGSWKADWRVIGGKRAYFRSRWEANYARYLEWLKVIGNIAEWEHEPETFWFKGVKRGCVSYLPDFRVTNPNGGIEYHEVKGWMDSKSKTKIKRMRKYHPSVVLKVINAVAYKKLSSQVKLTIPGWELNSKGQ